MTQPTGQPAGVEQSARTKAVTLNGDRATGELLVEALAEYHGAVDAGQAPIRHDFLQRYPEIAEELNGYLDGFDFVRQVAPQLREPAEGASSTPSLAARATLGDFQIVREIGRGGMGVVYEAEQLSLGRRVALKVLPFAAMLDRQQLARFKNEARAAATLDHPNIVAIYSVGCDRSVHYYAMQLIEGQSLAEVIEQMRRESGRAVEQKSSRAVEQQWSSGVEEQSTGYSTPPLLHSSSSRDTQPVAALSTLPDFDSREYYRAVAELGIQAAEALDHAHASGILHRDIKPANLLFEFVTPRPVPVRGRETGYERTEREGYIPKLWITDFGLARMEADAGMTMTGDVLGTLRYMSPEQALAKRAVIDHRSDIYSLGATFYELVTLQPLFGNGDRAELLRNILDQEPISPRKLKSQVPRDLETIILNALRKDPNDRYQSAHHLANDFRSFLESKPIKAKPPTTADLATKWVRRHQTAVTAAALGLMLVTMTLAVSVILLNRARVKTLTALNEISDMHYMSDMTSAFEAWHRGHGEKVQEILRRQLPVAGMRDRRGLEWDLLNRVTRQPAAMEWRAHSGAVLDLAVLRKRGLLVSVGQDGALRFWHAGTGVLVKEILLSDPLISLAVSAEEQYVAAGAGNGIIYLCDLSNEFALSRLHSDKWGESGSGKSVGPAGWIKQIAFSPDGLHIAVVRRPTEVCLLDLRGNVVQRTPHGAWSTSLDFMPKRSLLHIVEFRHGNKCIELWRADLSRMEKELVVAPQEAAFDCRVRSLPNEKFLAVSREKNIALFDLASSRIIATTPQSASGPADFVFSPDGKRIAAGLWSGEIQIFELQFDGNDVSITTRPGGIKAHVGKVSCIRFLDDRTVATCGSDGFVRIWNLATGMLARSWGIPAVATASSVSLEERRSLSQPIVVLPWKQPPLGHPTNGVKLSPDGSLLAYLGQSETLLYDTNNGDMIRRLNVPSQGVAWSPAGDKLAICQADLPNVEVVNRLGQTQFLVSTDLPPRDAAFSPTDDLMAVVDDRQLQLYCTDSREIIHSEVLDGSGLAVTFSHSGKQVAFGGLFEKIVLFDTLYRKVIRQIPGRWDPHCLAFSPNDSLLAAGLEDGAIRIWEANTGQLRAELFGHESSVREITFSIDGRTLISSSCDKTVRLWSVEHGRSYGILYAPVNRNLYEYDFSVSADGKHFAVACKAQNGVPEVHLWHTTSAEKSKQGGP
jgi:WD40 repeat protein/serine/threonine protein kinase